MKTYRYLYYKLYYLWLKKKDEPENAHINAVITMTFLEYTNIFSIALIILIATKKRIIILPEFNSNTKIWFVLVIIFTGIFNYFYLARKRKHNKIIEEFNSEGLKQSKRDYAVTILYIIFSLLIPLYIFLFTKP